MAKLKIKLLPKLQIVFFYLVLLFLPAQLGKHFWPPFSQVLGIRVDYLSPTVYFTDILILLLFISWIIQKLSIKIRLKFTIYHLPFTIFLLIIFLSIGTILSKSPLAGWYGLLKFIELLFFGFYTAKNIKTIKQWQTIVSLFSIGILFESFLTIAQYFLQHSLNGFFYFFGERAFSPQTPNIANVSINGQLILRPYGTFSHPNVLAGYLTITMAMVIFNFQFLIFNLKKIICALSLILGTLALFLTMGRVAILLWLAIAIVYFLRLIKKRNLQIGLLVVLVLIGSIFPPLVWLRFTGSNLGETSIVQRKDLIIASFQMVKSSPFFGVGSNNFLINLPQFYVSKSSVFYLQPVHNIYLLVASETGIIGLGVFLWFLAKTFKRIMNNESRIRKESIIHNPRFIILIVVLVLGFFDHYFLTLQQGQLLFSFILGLCWVRFRKGNHVKY